MLGNLDNEVIFKKAFTDKVVFKAFVRDILGIEVEVDKIETEKRFEPKIGYVDFELTYSPKLPTSAFVLRFSE